MSTLYETCALPKGKRCIRVLEILPVTSRPSESEIQRRDTLNPILHIDRPGNVLDNPPHAPLRFRLKILDLDTGPDFTALSYVWGLPTASQPEIKYSNTTVAVTENCYAALVHLRKALGGFTIWVDAICINQAQENNEERSAQLPLMGEIYSRARTVYIWLGEGTPGTDRAMRYLGREKLSRYCTIDEHGRLVMRPWAAAWAIVKAHWSRDSHPILSISRRNSRKASPTESPSDIEELLSRPWIGRLWTYQEILLAESPVVVCGDCHVPWLNFERNLVPLTNTYFCQEVGSAYAWKSISIGREQLRAQDKHLAFSTLTMTQYEAFITRISRRHKFLELGAGFIFALWALGLIVSSQTYRNAQPRHKTNRLALEIFAIGSVLSFLIVVFFGQTRRSSPSRSWRKAPVEDLTSCLYARDAREPKDMAFGVWAVLQKKAIDIPLPEITYANDLGHIYWTLSMELIQRTSSIQLLYWAASKGISGAPSWVPDWSARNGHQWRTAISDITQLDFYGRPFTVPMGNWNKYVERDISAYFEFDATGKVLTVRGRHVCNIDRLSHMDFQETGETFHESEQDTHLENLRLILTHVSPRRTIYDSFFRARDSRNLFPFDLLGRAGKYRHDPWFKEHASQISAWTRFCKRHALKPPSTVLALLRGEDAPPNESVLATQIMMSNLLARDGRPLFQSSRASSAYKVAHLRGVCGRNAEIGDQIVRIVGLSQLLVLRAIAGEANSVRIVSPAGLYGRPKGPSWARRLGLAGEEEDCVQYRIH